MNTQKFCSSNFWFCLGLVLVSSIIITCCWKNEGIEIIKGLKAVPGNGCVLLQWDFLGMGNDAVEVNIYRSDGDSLHWNNIAFQDTVYYYAMAIGRFLDRTVQNGKKYYYKVSSSHILPEMASKYSNIVSVEPTPLSPSNPVAPPCTNIVVTPSGDSFIVTWEPPQGNDGLYYFAHHSDSLARPDNWVSNWAPETLSTPKYVLKPLNTSNFRILVLVGGILNETSRPIFLRRAQ